MSPTTLADIAAITGGTLLNGDGSAVITNVSTDSRTLAAGDLFIALRGDTHDGHNKLDEVAAKGAAAAIVEQLTDGISSPSPLVGEGGVRGLSVEPRSLAERTLPPNPSRKGRGEEREDAPLAPPPPGEAGWGRGAYDSATEQFDAHRPHLTSPGGGRTGLAFIQVADTRKALGQLATHARRHLTKTKVLAVAGSNGKTTTKNLLHAVLSTRLKGTASPKSFNNDIGVPATLLPVDPNDQYVIIEVGTNHPGEIENLSLIAEPDLAIITSIGEEHLEFFGDLDGVRKENAQIVAGLRLGAPLIVTGDDTGLLAELPLDRRITCFGFAEGNDLQATDVRVTPQGTHFCFEEQHWFLPLVGAHFAACGLAVIATARWMGLSDDDIRTGLASATPSDMRMQPRDCGGIMLLNDAYNANPTSMRAALATAAEIAPPRRLVLVLGEMGELGAASAAAHESIVAVASQTPAVLVTVGSAFESLAANGHWFPDSAAAAAAIVPILHPGDVVLLKGSRSVKLERVAEAIAAAADNGAFV